jgi:murein DD-endopeptidase MepM/ murein hydrolase activator NlpD
MLWYNISTRKELKERRKMRRKKKQSRLFNKKGQVFMGFLVILTLTIFSMVYVILLQKHGDFSKDIGERQAAVLAAAQEAEKAQLYIDLAATFAYDAALLNVADGWYTVDSDCGKYRGVPVIYGSTDCMEYGEELQEALNSDVSGTFGGTLSPYLEAYQNAPLLGVDYELRFEDEKLIAISTEALVMPVFSKTSVEVEEKKGDTQESSTVSGSPSYLSSLSFDLWPSSLESKYVTSCFGERSVKGGSKYHPGVDIGAYGQIPILAVADGNVIETVASWGRVVVDHGNGISTAYLHMYEVMVEVGDTVIKGQQVGTSGGRGYKTNRETGEVIKQGNNVYSEHLHFELFIEDMVGLDIKDGWGNSGVLSDFGKDGAVNPLCFLDTNDVDVRQSVTNGCLEYGGAYKFCDQYQKYAPQMYEEAQLLLGASPITGCSGGNWHVESSNYGQITYEQWELSMQEAGVQGYGSVLKLPGNGPTDSYYRLNGDIGRETISFVPCTTDTSKPVELIYYFHGSSGFTGRAFDVIMPQMLEMMQEGRNFVLVYPELTWSMGDPTSTGSTPFCTRCKGTNDAPRQKGLLWVTSLGDGHFGEFHEQVLDEFVALGVHDIGTITMLGHSAGGGALHNAAPFMTDIGVEMVKLSDSDYYGASKAIWRYAPQMPQYIFFQYYTEIDDLAMIGDGTPTRFAIDFLEDKLGVDPSVLVAGEMYTVPGYEQIHALPLRKTHAEISGSSLAWTPEDVE